jgi:xanthine dehydrogenase accessory factor
MHTTPLASLFSPNARSLAVIMGTNEIASAIAAELTRDGYSVIMSYDPFPPVIRRGMAFHDALFDDHASLDGVVGERAETALEIASVFYKSARVAVTPLQLTDIMALRRPDVLIDARMQKHRVTPDLRGLSRLSIGVGPNFTVSVNCDVAIETHPAKTGVLIESGKTAKADGAPRKLGGVGKERFIYTSRPGQWRTPMDIGMRVFKGVLIGHHDGAPIYASIDGHLRGIARDSTHVPEGVKLIEIDPRGRRACWTGSDQRGRAIARALSKAVFKRSTTRTRALA